MIRNLQENDKSAILKLGYSIFRKEDEIPLLQKALLLCVPELSFVAVDTTIIGFTLVCITPTNVYFTFTIPHCYELAFLGISPTHQGRGIGSKLLKKTLSCIFQQAKTCWLLVDTSNTGAIAMYEKLGFRRWITIYLDIPGYIMGLSYKRYMNTLHAG